MASAELSAEDVFKACAEGLDFIAERRNGSNPVANSDGGEKMLKNLRALAACCIAGVGSDATITVTAEEAFWLVDWFRKPKHGDGDE